MIPTRNIEIDYPDHVEVLHWLKARMKIVIKVRLRLISLENQNEYIVYLTKIKEISGLYRMIQKMIISQYGCGERKPKNLISMLEEQYIEKFLELGNEFEVSLHELYAILVKKEVEQKQKNKRLFLIYTLVEIYLLICMLFPVVIIML